MRLCVALTNLHVRFNPLCSADLTCFQSYDVRRLEIGDSMLSKKLQSQKSYRYKRLTQMERQYMAEYNAESEDAVPTMSS